MLIEKLNDLFKDRKVIFVWNYDDEHYLVNAILNEMDDDGMFLVNRKTFKSEKFPVSLYLDDYMRVTKTTPIYDRS